MDKMFWFGWFFKGSLAISFFDRLMLVGEIAALIVSAGTVAYIIDKVCRFFGGKGFK